MGIPQEQKTSPKTKTEELFDVIQSVNGGEVSVQQVGATKLHALTGNGSRLHAHPMPTMIDRASYWQHIAAHKTPMIVQLETDDVKYLQNAPGADQPNPETISEPFHTAGLIVSIGTGTKITDGVSEYPVDLNTSSPLGSTRLLRVCWADHSTIPEETLQTIVERIPNEAAVHCMQGKGRTGVIAIAHQMNAAFQAGNLKKNEVVSFIFHAIREARQQRQSDSLVENPAQFEALIKHGQKLTSATDDGIQQQIIRQIAYATTNTPESELPKVDIDHQDTGLLDETMNDQRPKGQGQ